MWIAYIVVLIVLMVLELVYFKISVISLTGPTKGRRTVPLCCAVELHGTLHTRQLPQLNKVVDEAQGDVFFGGSVRSW